MPWKYMSIMNAKVEFINEIRSGTSTISYLCRQFGISGTLDYKDLLPFELRGREGL